jgi:hypothetical protein
MGQMFTSIYHVVCYHLLTSREDAIMGANHHRWLCSQFLLFVRLNITESRISIEIDKAPYRVREKLNLCSGYGGFYLFR